MIGNSINSAYKALHIVRSLNYCSAAQHNLSLLLMCYACPMHVQQIPNGLSTKKLCYTTATLRYDTLPFYSYRTRHTAEYVILKYKAHWLLSI